MGDSIPQKCTTRTSENFASNRIFFSLNCNLNCQKFIRMHTQQVSYLFVWLTGWQLAGYWLASCWLLADFRLASGWLLAGFWLASDLPTFLKLQLECLQARVQFATELPGELDMNLQQRPALMPILATRGTAYSMAGRILPSDWSTLLYIFK